MMRSKKNLKMFISKAQFKESKLVFFIFKTSKKDTQTVQLFQLVKYDSLLSMS